MIDRLFICEKLGELSIQINDITYLFDEYKNIYSKVFKTDPTNFEKQKQFKLNRGGFVITIFKESNLLGFFSLTKGNFNFLEFGDLAKVSKLLPSKTFANLIDLSCKEIINNTNRGGIYTYPNFYASRLLRKSGFNLISYYQRKVYIIIFCIKILLPIVIYQNRIYLNKKFNLINFIGLVNFEIIPTRLSLLNLRVFKKGTKPLFFRNISNFGFLYTYETNKKSGDHFLVFKKRKFPLEKIDFQFSDNSA